MKYFNTVFFSLMVCSFLLSSCGKSEAERLGIKWCECNMEKAELFKELDQTTEVAKINNLVAAIMIEEQSAIDCMGAKKLKSLEEKLNAREKGEFQQLYDKTRKDLCPESLKLLKKKAPKVPEIPKKIQEEKADSNIVADSLSQNNSDSLNTEED